MRPVYAVALLVGLGATPALAQDRPGPVSEKARYFSKPVDLWGTGLRWAPPEAAPLPEEGTPSKVAVRENVWAQPVRTPDGSYVIYVPPREVLDFLEDPTEASGRAYLAWKEKQAAKLSKAMLLLGQLKDSAGQGARGDPPTPAETAPLARVGPFRITYFKKPSCPHCVTQDAVLAAWLPKRPEGQLEVVLPGEQPELWAAYQVRGTPTLVVEVGQPPRREVLVGLQAEAALEAALGRLAQAPPVPKAESRKDGVR